MRLNEIPPHMIPPDRIATSLNRDDLYLPWRVFWSLPIVNEAIDMACNEVYRSVERNDHKYFRHLERDEAGQEVEIYSCIERPWFVAPRPTESNVRMRLRGDKVEDCAREQAILYLFQNHLHAALSDINEAQPFLSLIWGPKDWGEILNASAWKALDDVLGLYEAHEAKETLNSTVNFNHLCKIYGYALRGPGVTNLANRIALRFSRIGFLNVIVSGRVYRASVGPVYRKLYHIVYEPLAEKFTTMIKETENDKLPSSKAIAKARLGAYSGNNGCTRSFDLG